MPKTMPILIKRSRGLSRIFWTFAREQSCLQVSTPSPLSLSQKLFPQRLLTQVFFVLVLEFKSHIPVEQTESAVQIPPTAKRDGWGVVVAPPPELPPPPCSACVVKWMVSLPRLF